MDVRNLDSNRLLKDILIAPIYDIVEHTPLTQMQTLSARYNCQVLLKREDLQPVFSFKIRGAHNKIKKVVQQRGSDVEIITASAGNHAQGVALSASTLGLTAKIVMPITTPSIKVEAVRHFGGEAVLYGENFDEANAYALALAKEAASSAVFVPPFDDIDVIVGQATVAKELLEQSADLDCVFIPVGGGGLIAGMAFYIKQLAPHIKVIAVEDENSASFKAAWHAGEPIELPYVGSFADGTAVKKVGQTSFMVAKDYVDDCITVTSDEICSAIKDVFDDLRVCVEPSGALALAGSKKWLAQQPNNRSSELNQNLLRVAAVCSGANLNFNSLRYVSERTELGEQKEAIVAVKIPEQKGSFLGFCESLGPLAITEFNYRFQANTEHAEIFVGIKLRSGESERQQVFHRLQDNGFAFTDLSDNELAKVHGRHLIGGKLTQQFRERLYRFEFPEHVGALTKFLRTLGDGWNITLFHYRNHGAAIGQVLCGFNCAGDEQALHEHFNEIGFVWFDETDNPIFDLFLK